MLKRLTIGFRALIFRSRMETELRDELSFHLEREREENIARGMDPEDARLAALRSFGGVEQMTEQCRDERGIHALEAIRQDLRYALRMLSKNPGFTLIAVLMLGLGIGANTAIFSVVNGVLFNPLPFAESGRLMDLNEIRRDMADGATSYPNFVDWRSQQTLFDRLAVYRETTFTLLSHDEPTHLRALVASADLFPVLKAEPVLGRNFLPEEDNAGSHLVILSHSAWQKRFASDQNIVGKALMLSGKSFTVVGVMPSGFTFPIQATPVDIWTTVAVDAESSDDHGIITEQRGHREWGVIARLKQDATVQQAQLEMNTIEARLTSQYPDVFANHRIELKPYKEKLVGNVKPALLTLFVAVSFLLLITCANVANLLVARAVTRQKEMAVRAALGATRGRIVRQLLTESMLLALIGGALGILLAFWGTDLLKSLSPEGLPRVGEIGVNGTVLAFTMLISLLTGIIFGLAPALRASRIELNDTLKNGGRNSSESHGRIHTRSVLVVVEVALALMLLAGAGLLISSFLRLQEVNPGFDSRNVLTMMVDPPDTRYRTSQQLIDFHRQLVDRAQRVPGVRAAAIVYPLPLSGDDAGTTLEVEGKPIEQSRRPRLHVRWASSGYFRTMDIRLIKGRDFDEHDESTAKKVVIINESLARTFFPNEDPIGKRIGRGEAASFREIVGVVADVKHEGPGTDSGLEVYLPYLQSQSGPMALLVRTELAPMNLKNAVLSEVSALDKEVPIDNVKTMDQYLASSVAQPRFDSLLLTIFAVVAMLLTAIGLYGVMAYSVAQQTREIGIRMAMGARSQDVLLLIIGQGMKLVLLGLGLGIAGAFALTRFLKTLLFEVSPTDPLTFTLIVLVLTVSALLACWVPAHRAAKVDPMVALRFE
jgi:putative ABC transport system permease protein